EALDGTRTCAPSKACAPAVRGSSTPRYRRGSASASAIPGDSPIPTVTPTRRREHPIGGGGEFTAPGRMERMTVLDRASARRSVDALTAIGFGALASAPEPGLFMVLLTGIAAIAIGLWSRGLPAGLGGLAVLVVVSMARAVWLDGHGLYLAEELPPALMRAGVPWLIGLAVRQY